jgi:hypothetical protein
MNTTLLQTENEFAHTRQAHVYTHRAQAQAPIYTPDTEDTEDRHRRHRRQQSKEKRTVATKTETTVHSETHIHRHTHTPKPSHKKKLPTTFLSATSPHSQNEVIPPRTVGPKQKLNPRAVRVGDQLELLAIILYFITDLLPHFLFIYSPSVARLGPLVELLSGAYMRFQRIS